MRGTGRSCAAAPNACSLSSCRVLAILPAPLLAAHVGYFGRLVLRLVGGRDLALFVIAEHGRCGATRRCPSSGAAAPNRADRQPCAAMLCCTAQPKFGRRLVGRRVGEILRPVAARIGVCDIADIADFHARIVARRLVRAHQDARARHPQRGQTLREIADRGGGVAAGRRRDRDRAVAVLEIVGDEFVEARRVLGQQARVGRREGQLDRGVARLDRDRMIDRAVVG